MHLWFNMWLIFCCLPLHFDLFCLFSRLTVHLDVYILSILALSILCQLFCFNMLRFSTSRLSNSTCFDFSSACYYNLTHFVYFKNVSLILYIPLLLHIVSMLSVLFLQPTSKIYLLCLYIGVPIWLNICLLFCRLTLHLYLIWILTILPLLFNQFSLFNMVNIYSYACIFNLCCLFSSVTIHWNMFLFFWDLLLHLNLFHIFYRYTIIFLWYFWCIMNPLYTNQIYLDESNTRGFVFFSTGYSAKKFSSVYTSAWLSVWISFASS